MGACQYISFVHVHIHSGESDLRASFDVASSEICVDLRASFDRASSEMRVDITANSKSYRL